MKKFLLAAGAVMAAVPVFAEEGSIWGYPYTASSPYAASSVEDGKLHNLEIVFDRGTLTAAEASFMDDVLLLKEAALIPQGEGKAPISVSAIAIPGKEAVKAVFDADFCENGKETRPLPEVYFEGLTLEMPVVIPEGTDTMRTSFGAGTLALGVGEDGCVGLSAANLKDMVVSGSVANRAQILAQKVAISAVNASGWNIETMGWFARTHDEREIGRISQLDVGLRGANQSPMDALTALYRGQPLDAEVSFSIRGLDLDTVSLIGAAAVSEKGLPERVSGEATGVVALTDKRFEVSVDGDMEGIAKGKAIANFNISPSASMLPVPFADPRISAALSRLKLTGAELQFSDLGAFAIFQAATGRSVSGLAQSLSAKASYLPEPIGSNVKAWIEAFATTGRANARLEPPVPVGLPDAITAMMINPSGLKDAFGVTVSE